MTQSVLWIGDSNFLCAKLTKELSRLLCDGSEEVEVIELSVDTGDSAESIMNSAVDAAVSAVVIQYNRADIVGPFIEACPADMMLLSPKYVIAACQDDIDVEVVLRCGYKPLKFEEFYRPVVVLGEMYVVEEPVAVTMS